MINYKSIQHNWIPILGALLGSVAGFVYYLKVGCVSGGCMITSNPYISTIYGGVLGVLVANIIRPERKKVE